MTSIPNYIMKKNNTLGIKSKKKSIPININSNPTPGKFLFSNQINNIASSYLSMGQKIQTNKNLKTSKLIHVNTNSCTNYYTTNSKETKQTNSSISSSIPNNIKNYNRSEVNSININNYININNNNSTNHKEFKSSEKNNHNYNNIIFNSRDKRQLSTISNSHLSNNDVMINLYHGSSNNSNNSKLKNRVNSINTSNNLPKTRQTYSTRANFLDSRNKTKKIPMKSKMRQSKYQNISNKPISSSFSNVYTTKSCFQRSDANNYCKVNLVSNNINEKNIENNYKKNQNINNYNFINHKNQSEIRNRHFRHNTTSFGNKDIRNIFHHKKSFSKINKLNNLNNIGNININNNICINHEISNKNINVNQIKKNTIKNISIKEPNLAVQNIISKIKINNSKKRINQINKGKINDGKIYVNEKRLNLKESNYNPNKINNYNNHIIYYSKNTSNNNSHIIKNHINHANISHQIKVTNSNNTSITGVKKIFVKQKEIKKLNKNYINNKPIPTPNQIVKSNIIPSQRNIKINLAKFLQEVKNKSNNKLVIGRKSLSIKRISKGNNTDFSTTQTNGKLTQKISKNNDQINQVNINNLNNKNNINNKIVYDDNKKVIDNKRIENEKNDGKKSDTKLNSDNNLEINKKEVKNKDPNGPINLLNDICNNNYKKNNKKNNFISNNNSTINNYINNKYDYSTDNIPEPINNIAKKNDIKDNIQNITDFNNSNIKNNIIEENDDKIINDKNNDEIEIENDKKDDLDKEDFINYDKNILDNKNYDNKDDNNKLINNIKNILFDEDNLDELPDDYDENFNDLYSIINKMNFGNVLVCVEGLFTPEGRTYKKYKDKFDKLYDKAFFKKGNSFSNSNNKPKKIIEVATSNAKTNSSSSKKKNIVSPNLMNDLNIVKELNVN